jgi:trimethylamine:corrinoid methyltransferase-like protein
MNRQKQQLANKANCNMIYGWHQSGVEHSIRHTRDTKQINKEYKHITTIQRLEQQDAIDKFENVSTAFRNSGQKIVGL